MHIDRMLLDILNSLVASSAWQVSRGMYHLRTRLLTCIICAQPVFQRAIDEYPEFSLYELDDDNRNGPCQACSMGISRHATKRLEIGVSRCNKPTASARSELMGPWLIAGHPIRPTNAQSQGTRQEEEEAID